MASQLSDVSPSSASQGQEVTLNGIDSNKDTQGTVTIGELNAQITSWTSVKKKFTTEFGFVFYMWVATIKALVPNCGLGTKAVFYTPQGEASSNSINIEIV